MKYNYEFFINGNLVGDLTLREGQAVAVAESINADSFINCETLKKYGKCAECGKWEKADDLINGLCSCCNYQQQIQEFIDFVDGELNKAFEGKINLFDEYFILTFKDMTLKLPYGAIQYNNILLCLETILKENKEI